MSRYPSLVLPALVTVLASIFLSASACRAQSDAYWTDLANLERRQDWAAMERRLQDASADRRSSYKFCYYRIVALYHTQRLAEGDAERDQCLRAARAQLASEDAVRVQDRFAAARAHAVPAAPIATPAMAEIAQPTPANDAPVEHVHGDFKGDKP